MEKELVTNIMDELVPYELQTVSVTLFIEECIKCIQLYAKKNHDYGNSFNKGMDDLGVIYGIGRLYDKMNRIITLTKTEPEIKEEQLEDTIQDLSCYSIMTSIYFNMQHNKNVSTIDFEGSNDNTQKKIQ